MSDPRLRLLNFTIHMSDDHIAFRSRPARSSDSLAGPPLPDAGESEEEIPEIQIRFGEPRQNAQPSSPGLPESVYSSTESDNEVAEDLQCSICASGREIKVQFRGCPHASCTQCVKNLWWSRVQNDTHYPTWFSCPWCRTKITEVGMVSRERSEPTPGDVTVHGGVSFTVCTWEKLVEWMNSRSKRMIVRAEQVAEARARLAANDYAIAEEELQGISLEQHARIFGVMTGGMSSWGFGRRITAFELEHLTSRQRSSIRAIIAEGASSLWAA